MDFQNSQDVSNVILLEHINLYVSDHMTALIFYNDALGFLRDPYKEGSSTMWINIGNQQLHLPVSKTAQRFRGVIGVRYDLSSLTQGFC